MSDFVDIHFFTNQKIKIIIKILKTVFNFQQYRIPVLAKYFLVVTMCYVYQRRKFHCTQSNSHRRTSNKNKPTCGASKLELE